MELSIQAKQFALNAHRSTNHLYNDLPYEFHLNMCQTFFDQFIYLVPTDKVEIWRAALWLHDTVEDCRVTYNDILDMFGTEVAEIVFAVTNEKGRSRKDRENDRFFYGVKAMFGATFVKVCDRLANASYSATQMNSMLSKYRSENKKFESMLYEPRYHSMFQALREILA